MCELIQHLQSTESFGISCDISYCRPLYVNRISDPNTAVMFTESKLVILYSVKYQHGEQLLQQGEKKADVSLHAALQSTGEDFEVVVPIPTCNR